MALETTNSPATDVKSAHPQPAAAGADAARDQSTKKADVPVGGGLGAASLAEVRKLASAVEKPVLADLKTLIFTPFDHAAAAMSASVKPADNSFAATKNPVANAMGEKAAAATAPDSKTSTATALKDVTTKAPLDPNQNKSIYTRFGEALAEDLGVPKLLINSVEYVAGVAWDEVGNYATDLLQNKNLEQSMVSKSKDGQIQIDQQKAQQVIDMQAMKNVFQGNSGTQHILQVDKMFSQASAHDPADGKGTADASKETATYKALDAQRAQMLVAGHRPGDSWSDNKGVYSLDKAGDLLEVTGSANNREIKWIGQNGQSYEKDPSGNETWTKDGREIKQVSQGNFQFTDEFGNTTSVDGPAGITVRRVAEGTITSYNQNRTAITRQAAAQLNDGISTNPNAALYSHHDAAGNQLVKDSLVHGETIFAKDGSNYRIHDGQIYLEDKYGQEQKIGKLPDFMKRLDNGDLKFDDITIDKTDFMIASDFNTQMADKTPTVTAGSGKHKLTVTALNGNVSLVVSGEFTATAHTDSKTGITTEHQLSASNQNEFDYNFKTGTMAGDGITFTKNGSHIRGTNFAVNSRDQIESASSWDAQNYASGIFDASDAYIRARGNYNESSSSSGGANSPNADGSDGNEIGGNQNGSGDGGSDSDDTPGSYEQYDKEKEREEKKEEKELSLWDALQTKLQAQAAQAVVATGESKWREDLKSGKLFELPESWKVAKIKDSVNISGLQRSIERTQQGTVDTGDVALLETSKAQLGSAASKFGFDADGYLATLDGIEAKIEREVSVKAALQEVGVDANPEHMWRVHENGGTVLAAREIEEQESA
jgi:hypothetical protein